MIIPMQKFNLVVPKEKKENLLSFLQEQGNVEIVDVAKKATDIPEHEIDLLIAELDFVLDLFRDRAPKIKESFGLKIKKTLSGPKAWTDQEFIRVCQSFDYLTLIQDLKKGDNQLVKLESEERELSVKREALLPWQNLGLSRAEMETERACSILGVIPEQNLVNLGKIADGEVYIRKVSEIGSNYHIAITYLKSNGEKFLKNLQSAGFSEVKLETEEAPDAAIAGIGQKLQENRKAKKKILQKIKEASGQADKVKAVFDYLTNQKKLRDANSLICDTKYMSLISGWTSEEAFRNLEKTLSQKFQDVYIAPIAKTENERTPVVIANQKFMEPFESVTRVYGLPEYNELDPTPYLSVFFAIFFGMCLSDAGYGLVLLVLCVLGVKFLALSFEFKRLLRLMIYCSITTIIVGVLYGAYFSISLVDSAASPLRDFLLRLQVIDPIKSPLQIMIISLLFGLLQGWFAKIVNMKYLLSKKRYKDAFLGEFIWILAILALVFFGAAKLFVPALAKISGYAVIGFAILLVLTQGYQKKNIFLKFTSGLLSLYKVVGMLSDVLSYSRLLALGLTTSIIGLVINVIALLFRDMIPHVGFLVMIPILIGGHLFNMVINILGGFIHSARLQFVEFFPKFMEGGGRIFKPLKKEYKFTRIQE
ncbi:MAG: V-type ATP synthase subunit I [bacterium]|nr:V-type ATP synthase subunit I [bacterium]